MMTQEETIINIKNLIALFHTASEQSKMVDYSKIIETLEFAAAALRPVGREQVEKVWSGMWIYDPDTGYAYCEMCKHTICQTDYLNGKLPPFCEMCGAPMTDEAVQMVMERLEALYGKAD